MSEYQWIEFRAIESPLDQEAIKFMHSQSSRAEIDQWHFAKEYNFGRFHGDVLEMLRRGCDFFVHYSSFGQVASKDNVRVTAELAALKQTISRFETKIARLLSQSSEFSAVEVQLSSIGDVQAARAPLRRESINDRLQFFEQSLRGANKIWSR